MILSYDYKSSYPFILCTFDGFPISSFVRYGDIESQQEFNKLLKEKCCLFRIHFNHLRIKPFNPITCISISKIIGKADIKIRDNGRLVEGYGINLTCNETDLKMIFENYDVLDGYKISDLYVAKKGKLPDSIRYGVFDLFKEKCELEKHKKEPDGQYNYDKFKNLLNACFGMSLTDVVHGEVIVQDIENLQDKEKLWKEEPKDTQTELDKYFKNWNSFLYYPWGLWVTTYGRYRLTQLIRCCWDNGNGTPYYWDTDSCKGVGWNMEKLKQLNDETIKILENENMIVSIDGKNYYLGIAELDCEMKFFKSLGAKKYCYVDKNNELHITIAGVNKSLGVKELKDIKNFNVDFTFTESGGQCAKYNDEPIHTLTFGGVSFETASNIAIVPTTYKLNSCDDYLSRTNFTILERRD